MNPLLIPTVISPFFFGPFYFLCFGPSIFSSYVVILHCFDLNLVLMICFLCVHIKISGC
jgi:hypothetical protein